MSETQVQARAGTSSDEARRAFDDIVINARLYPDHVAVSRQADDGRWNPVRSSELADQVAALAAGLVAHDIAPGDRVAIMSRTRYEWLLLDYAILSIGAVTVPIYETSSDSQVEWILRDSGAVAVAVEGETHARQVESITGHLPDLRAVWVIPDDLATLTHDGHAVAPETMASRRDAVQPEDLATIVYTSGTTGRPKGCMLTHDNIVSTVRNVTSDATIQEFVFNDEQSTLLFLPLAHILARIIQCGSLHCRVRLGHLPDIKQVPAGLASFQPTVLLSVPRIFEKIHATAQRSAARAPRRWVFAFAERTAIDYSRALDEGGPTGMLWLRHALCDALVYRKLRAFMGGNIRWAVSGGAPLGATLGHFFRGAGVNVLEGYGLTESTAGGTLNLPGTQRVGSVGPAILGCEIRIADDGEILMRGPQVFRGYWQNETATSEILDADGWLHTGDVGNVDDDGFVFITDRKKDLIVTSAGKNVAPSMLEDRLRANWLISQAAVVGDKRPYVAALLTLDAEALGVWREQRGKPAVSGVALDTDPDLLHELEAAVAAANAEVSQAEAIKRWVVLDNDFSEATGELTPTMKVKRNVILTQFAHEIETLYR